MINGYGNCCADKGGNWIFDFLVLEMIAVVWCWCVGKSIGFGNDELSSSSGWLGYSSALRPFWW